MELMQAYNKAEQAVFDHVGYVEDWRVLPIDDSTDQYWCLVQREDGGGHVRFSPKREAIEYWAKNNDYGEYDDDVYENQIYTQRHLPRWVYRGEVLTMVVVDTHTDGNKLLQVFKNDMEIRP